MINTYLRDSLNYCVKCDIIHDTKNCPYDSSVGKPRLVNADKVLETNAYEREVWNNAIEAAANMVYNSDGFLHADTIRKLKK